MKNLSVCLLFVILLFGCTSNDPKVFQIDPLATVNIKGAVGTVQKVKSLNDTVAHLTALQIVKQTEMIRFVLPNGTVATRMFMSLQRDTISKNPMLKLWATDILRYEEKIDGTQFGELLLVPEFLEAKNCVLLNYSGKIIAYIPDTILRSAETKIKELFLAKNYESIYPVFNSAYTFMPISESEYIALVQ